MAVTAGGDEGHQALLDHLVTSRLAGGVATGARWSLDNCRRLLSGDPDYTFGLSDWRDASYPDVLEAVRAAGGTRLGDEGVEESEGSYIDPSATLAGIRAHHDAVATFLAAGGGRVVLATGHPFALLAHYGALARALAAGALGLALPGHFKARCEVHICSLADLARGGDGRSGRCRKRSGSLAGAIS